MILQSQFPDLHGETALPAMSARMVKPTMGGYAVYSHKTGKRISKVYKSAEAAKKRLKQIQFFKHKGGE